MSSFEKYYSKSIFKAYIPDSLIEALPPPRIMTLFGRGKKNNNVVKVNEIP